MASTRTSKAILLVDVEHLGHRGDIVSVAGGYLRNYLLPRKLAEVATTARVKEATRVREQRSRQEARTLEQAQEVAKTLSASTLKMPARAGVDGRLYGSITTADLTDEIWRSKRLRVDRRKIRLEEPIRHLGSYLVEIDVFPEVRAAVTVDVEAIEGFGFAADSSDAAE